MQIIDISTPASPGIVSSFATAGTAVDVEVRGGYAYIADGNSALQIIDISNPATPSVAGSYDTAIFGNGVAVIGDYAYMANNDGGLLVINISDPVAPVAVAACADSDNDTQVFAVDSSGIYLGRFGFGVEILQAYP